MSSDEVGSLLASIDEEGSELCGRVFQRPDGTLVTEECLPARRVPKAVQFNLKAAMVFIAGFAAMLGFAKWLVSRLASSMGGIRGNTARGDVRPRSTDVWDRRFRERCRRMR